MQKGLPPLEVADDYLEPNVPEKLLLLAVLERAFRDLFPHTDSLYRRNAIGWFNCENPNGKSYCKHPLISFKFIAETLELTITQIDYLKDFVRKAEKYEDGFTRQKQNREKIKEEGQESGEGMGQPLEKEWSSLSQEIGTGIWNRSGRRYSRRVITLSPRGKRC